MGDKRVGGDSCRLRTQEVTKDFLRDITFNTGAVAFGVAKAEPVSPDYCKAYSQWLEKGFHASMHYMTNNLGLRTDPRSLLDNAKSIICVAFSYHQPKLRSDRLPILAPYAYGRDYHKELRTRLRPLTSYLDSLGEDWRICIDSAPVHERYWALKAGIGMRCRNGCVAIEGYGTEIFLAEILTTLQLEPDKPSERKCRECDNCIKACPTGALRNDGTINCSLCMNYLTIEHKGPFNDEEALIIAKAEKKQPNGWWVGCDLCQRACPLNTNAKVTEITHFLPRKGIMTLTPESFDKLSDAEKENLLSGSALRRAIGRVSKQ